MQKINLHNYEAFLLDYFDGNLNETDLQELKTFVLLNPELDIDLGNDSLLTFNSDNELFINKKDLLKTEQDIYNEELLNYLEGNLSKNEKIIFEKKLASNADLKKELELYKKTDLNFTKEDLKFDTTQVLKTEDDLILNNVALNYVEDKLSSIEKIRFISELKNNSAIQNEVAELQKTKLIADLNTVYPNKEGLKKETKVIALFNFKTVSAIAAGLLLLVSLGFIFNYYLNSKIKEEGKIALQLENKTNFSIPKKQPTNSVITNSLLNNSSTNLIAKNSTNNFNPNQIKSNANQTNSINSNNNVPKNVIVNNNIKNDTLNSINSDTNNAIAVNTNSSTPLTFTNSVNSVTTQTILLAYEEDNEESFETNVTAQKNNFWKRAVKVAKQLNGLGLKAIKGDEKANNDYVLGFNSVSVEKK